jgi:hypothetical protein
MEEVNGSIPLGSTNETHPLGDVFRWWYHPLMNRELVRLDLRIIRAVRVISPTLSRELPSLSFFSGLGI